VSNTWCVIASGPSLTKEDCELVERAQAAGQCSVLVINNNFKMVPTATVLYACDGAWWRRYFHETAHFSGEKWSQDEAAASEFGLNHIPGENKQGLCTEPGRIHFGSNGGFQAINLAYHLGAKRIALLGYDMQYTNGQSHWHGDHENGLNNPRNIKHWLPMMNRLARDCERVGMEVVNCSRSTALECFERSTIEDFFSSHA
jgi:hypothetical protein